MATVSLRTLRRRAAAQGYRIWKVRKESALYWDYGPYTLTIVDSYAVELRGASLEELADFLEKPAELQETG